MAECECTGLAISELDLFVPIAGDYLVGVDDPLGTPITKRFDWPATLADLSALSVTNGNFIVGDGSNFVAENPATARASLGLGSIATQAANNVSISGGSITGITDLAIADGGTGQSAAQAAIDALSQVAGATDEHVLTKDTGTGNAIFKAAAGGASLPVVDTTSIVKGSADATKEMRFEVDGLTTATVRALTVQDFDGTILVTGGLDVPVADGGTGASNAATARANLGLAIGSNIQAWDTGLDALAAFNTNGLLAQTAEDTFAGRTLTGPAAGLTVTDGDGVAGNPTLALANDLLALEGLASTGLAVRTAADTWAQRTITGTANQVTVTNGNGVAGNPTLSTPQNIHTAATPTFGGMFLTGPLDFNGADPAIIFDVNANTLMGSSADDIIEIATGGTDRVTITNAGFALEAGDRVEEISTDATLGAAAYAASLISSAWVKLASTTLGAAGQITFSSIPAIYQALVVIGFAKSADTVNWNDTLGIQCNGDTGSNYSNGVIFSVGLGAVTPGANLAVTAARAAAIETSRAGVAAGEFTSIFIVLPNYTSTSEHKDFVSPPGFLRANGVAGNTLIEFRKPKWHNGTIAAVTSLKFLTIFDASNNMATDTELTLYGIF